MDSNTDNTPPTFETAAKAATDRNGNLITEFLGFLGENKKWWLLPILIALLAVSAVLILGATGAAPFIYTLF